MVIRLSDLIKPKAGRAGPPEPAEPSDEGSTQTAELVDVGAVDVIAEQLRKLRKSVDQRLEEEAASLPVPHDNPAARIYQRAERCVASLAEALLSERPLSLVEADQTAHEVVVGVMQDRTLLARALTVPQESSLIGNMVHTAILSTEIGLALGYRSDHLAQLALAALVHDIGMFRLPMSLVMRTGRWSKRQCAAMQKHIHMGAEALKGCEPEFAWVGELVRQEHERFNGSGYPSGLKGEQIHEPAQVIGLADRFDALLRSRTWRRGMSPHDAVRYMLSSERDQFSHRVLKGLVQCVTLYPPGTWVKLSSGQVGVVATVNPGYPLRPVVTLKQNGRRPEDGSPEQADLRHIPSLWISQVLAPIHVQHHVAR
jgi:HD-GYP domain-containing protein (c-di-GMP phosphodiesterase class II)